MSRSSLLESFQVNEKFGVIASHLLVAGMMVCFAVSIQHLARRIVPGWQANYIPWLVFWVSLEAMYSRRQVRRETDLITSRLVYRLVEWVVITMVVKLVISFSKGLDQLLVELPMWREDFLIHFFDGETIFVLLLSFVIWALSGGFSEQLLKLEGDRFLVEMDVEIGIFSDRTAVRRELVARIFLIGMIMVFVTALVRWDYQTIWGERPVPTYGLSYVMLYFLFGLALTTMTHFASRRAVWAMEQIPLSHGMSRQWLVYSLLFLAGVSILAFILPTGYSMGLIATLGYLFNLLFSIIAFIYYLLSLPLIFLMNLFVSPAEIPEPPERLPPREFVPPGPPLGGAGPLPWWEVLRSILFWVIFIAIIGYAFSTFIRQNEDLLKLLRGIPGWHYLVTFWGWLSAGLGRANRGARSAAQELVNRLHRTKDLVSPLRAGEFVNPRRLPPRQRVLFFYLMMLRRGQESGMPRRPSQTPFEYARKLEGDLPEVDEDLKSLTNAFVEARYSRHTITSERANLVQTYWNKIKRALRSQKKGSSTPK
jgi:hypothetical protein